MIAVCDSIQSDRLEPMRAEQPMRELAKRRQNKANKRNWRLKSLNQIGFLNRRSQVRFLPGVPERIQEFAAPCAAEKPCAHTIQHTSHTAASSPDPRNPCVHVQRYEAAS